MSYEESFAFVHLTGCLVILISLISLISVFYGNFLIDYLKIAERYPRFKKYIDLRLKFQHYFLWIDFFIILIVLVGIALVNIQVFLD